MRGASACGFTAAAVLGGLLAAGAARTATEEFVATGSMAGPRSTHDSVLLADGRVLVAGGVGNADGSSLGSAAVYDPDTGAWSAAGTLGTARSGGSMSLLPDGRVLVAGGSSLAPMFSSTEIWDPSNLAFTAGPSMSVPRGAHVAVTLADGRVLVAGGASTTASPVATVTAEVYDPDTNSWGATGSMVHRRQSHAAVLLADGRVLVSGGDEGSPTIFKGTALCQIYDPDTGTFSSAASMATPRSQHRMVRLLDGRVLAVGGNRNATGTEIRSAEIYDPEADSWAGAGTTTCGGTLPSLTLLADGRVLAAGGLGTSNAPTGLADVFDPETGSFSPLPSMLAVRMAHSANRLADGSVLLVGGYNNFTTYPYWNSTCERFVPVQANRAPVADAGADQEVECAGTSGTSATLDGTGSTDADGDGIAFTWTGDFGTATGATPTVSLSRGTHAITLTVDDGKGTTTSDEVVVAIVDTTAPVISGVSADPSAIRARKHRMVAVAVSGTATDLCDAHPTLRITSVASNEELNGRGDGNTDVDWEITGDLTLNLRAERSGRGTGRVYTITLVATDADGNSSTSDVTVTVPKRWRRHSATDGNHDGKE